MGGPIFSDAVRAGADVMTFGTNELAGNPAGKMASGLFGNSPSTALASGNSPLSMLEQSGGGPLLGQIALGEDPTTAMASYFGVDPSNFNSWLAQQNPNDQAAIHGLTANLTAISQNQTMRQNAVTSLVQAYPTMMAQLIPQYTGIADKATAAAAQQALDQVSAKYAAGGGLSSGANAAAQALTSANTEQGNLLYGTNLAQQDYTQQFNSANALLQFQQKMLGQNSSQAMSAMQMMIQGNNSANQNNANAINTANTAANNSSNAMFGSLGALGAGMLMRGSSGGSSAPSSSMPNSGNPSNGNPNLNLTNPTTGGQLW